MILETVLTLVQGVAQWIIDRRVAFDRLEFVYPALAHFDAPVAA